MIDCQLRQSGKYLLQSTLKCVKGVHSALTLELQTRGQGHIGTQGAKLYPIHGTDAMTRDDLVLGINAIHDKFYNCNEEDEALRDIILTGLICLYEEQNQEP